MNRSVAAAAAAAAAAAVAAAARLERESLGSFELRSNQEIFPILFYLILKKN